METLITVRLLLGSVSILVQISCFLVLLLNTKPHCKHGFRLHLICILVLHVEVPFRLKIFAVDQNFPISNTIDAK